MNALLFVSLVMVTIAGSAALLLGAVWLGAVHTELATLRRRLQLLEGRAEKAAAAAPVAPLAPAEPDSAAPVEALAPAEPEPVAFQPAEPESTPAGGPPAATPAPAQPAAPKPPRFVFPSVERLLYWVAGAGGGFTLLLGLLFLVGVAIDRGWIGPAARVSMGLVAGTTLWLAGDWLRSRSWLPGAALSGAGVGALLGSLFAARVLYGFVPAPVAFGAMILVCALATAVASRRDDRFLAHLALTGGLLTPVLLSTGENAAIPFFSYLTVVVVGTLASAARRGWWDVVAYAAIGVTALHVGWTASWYTPDQAPIGLVAAGALTLPFAVIAARRATSLPTAVAAGGALLLIPCVALPWLVPVDAVFHDPRNGLMIVRPYAGQATWAALAAALLPAGAWFASRRRETPFGAALGTALAGLLLATLILGWSMASEPPAVELAASGILQIALAALLFTRSPAGPGASPVPLLAGVGLGLVFAGWAPGRELLLVSVLTIGALGAIGARLAHLSFLPATVAGVSVALLGASAHVDTLGFAPIAGPALVVFTLLGTAPLLGRWSPAERPWATLSASLAGPALYPAFHVAWNGTLGPSALAVLPLAVGAHAALGAAVVVRVHRAKPSDASLAVLIGVALFGLSAAIPLRLHDEALTITWAVEAAALALIARRLTHRLVPMAVIGLGFAVGVRLLLNPWALAYGDASGWPILNWTLYTWGVPAIAVGLARYWLAQALPAPGDLWSRFERFGARTLGWVAILLGFALVNVEVSHAFQGEGPLELMGTGLFQGMVRSLGWGVYGFVWLVVGLVRRDRSLRLIGFGFVLLATGKVFLVDLVTLEGIARVGSLLGMGVTLLVAAVLFDRLVLRDPRPTEEPT